MFYKHANLTECIDIYQIFKHVLYTCVYIFVIYTLIHTLLIKLTLCIHYHLKNRTKAGKFREKMAKVWMKVPQRVFRLRKRKQELGFPEYQVVWPNLILISIVISSNFISFKIWCIYNVLLSF